MLCTTSLDALLPSEVWLYGEFLTFHIKVNIKGRCLSSNTRDQVKLPKGGVLGLLEMLCDFKYNVPIQHIP